MKLMQKIDRSVFSYSHISFYPIPLYLLFLFSLLFLPGCEKQTTPVASPQIQLTVDEAAVTEAWLKLQVTNLESLEAVEITRRPGGKSGKDTTIYSGKPQSGDTTIYDNGLFPAHSYTYRVYSLFNGTRGNLRAKAELTTMDTTSHNFSWQLDTIGTYSSDLYDIAIVNQNDIWAVGEIHTPETDKFDSLGNWVPPYNAVHWNGQHWELKRFMVPGPGFSEIYSVFAFNHDEVWMGQGSARLWNGQQWIIYNSNNGFPGQYRVRKIWGTSFNNLYFVGEGGNVVSYNGKNWIRLYSGTDLNIYDIWGGINPKTGETEILAVATSWPNLNPEGAVLKISCPRATTVPDSGLPAALTNLWFMPGKIYYVAGDGLYYTRKIGQPWQHDTSQPLIYKSGIRGIDINDIIIVGGFGLVSHFNGKSWKHFAGEELPTFYGNYNQLDYKENMVVAVGWIGERAIILRGYRN